MVDNTGDNIVLKTPSGETKHIPRKFLGDEAYGKVDVKDIPMQGLINSAKSINPISMNPFSAASELADKYDKDIKQPFKEGVANLLGVDSDAKSIGRKVLSPFNFGKTEDAFDMIEESVGEYVSDPMSITDLIPGKAAGKAALGSLKKLRKLIGG